ncbi:MAG: polysaccharide deacetylase family protein [Paludibacter sp.]|nr:polysaccharide deacetylase family protein [Paludibacter sp.]
MKRLLLSYLLLSVVIGICYAVPGLQIKGENFGIQDLTKGNQIFYNRTTMPFGDIPADYTGWKTIKINANSSWQSGPLPSFQVKPDEDGYIYVLVANYEKPAVCAQWAEDNGWDSIPGLVISYGDTQAAKLYFYRKACVKDEWIDVVQPATFSGAIVIAPEITDVNSSVETIQAVSVSIVATGWMETSVLDNGTVAYANRSYVFGSVSEELADLNITRYNGGAPPKLKITAKETGDMYIAQSDEDQTYDVAANGWTKVDGLSFSYNDSYSTSFSIYKKSVEEGDIIEIKSTGWQGVLVLSSGTIDYVNQESWFNPPPGVVIHNSPATTNKYVGSPSIVVLPDGTYLASHDYFGSIISYAFVYKSTDKGETWEQIAQINTLNWAKLFTRGDELYLMGVAPKGTMGYGNVVILRSYDGGYTWTNPTNSTNGLLMDGYYTCAPTPVVFHKGRVWKAMENQGKVDGWGPFGAFMMSADENADLLNAANWTISNELQYVAGAIDAWTWLEGNAVIAKDGSMVDVLRLHYTPDNEAGIIKISDNGTTATFDPQTGISHLPGALKKFTIHYDSISNKYWTLSNYVLPADTNQGISLERVRNTMALCWSEDLVNWTIKEILLHVDDITHHGFQYADWDFDGDDIIAVIRTAWDDATGQANSQHNANYLTFHRFKNFRYERGSSSTGVMATRWYNNAKSAMALTFDDGFEAHYTYAYPVLKEHNIPATFFVNSGNLVHKGETQKDRYGFWEDFKTMSDNGYEIGSHSLTHADLTSLSADDVAEELEQDKENIETNIGKKCLSHAYPYCQNNEDVQEIATPLFIGARQCSSLENDASLSRSECYTINSDLLTWAEPRSLSNDSASFDDLKSSIESTVRRNRNFGVLCIHEVLPFSLLSTSDTYEIATTEWLTEMCEYLAEKKASGDIWPATFGDIVQYAQERDNMRVLRTEINSDSIEYDITVQTFLDTTVFYHPLTLTVNLPDGWTSARCRVMEAGTTMSDSIYTPSTGKFQINVIPDRQKLILVKEEASGIQNYSEKTDIRIYPNPVKNKIEIKSENPIKGFCSIYNMQGVCFFNQEFDSEHFIDVSNIMPGIYILHIENENISDSFRFVKE